MNYQRLIVTVLHLPVMLRIDTFRLRILGKREGLNGFETSKSPNFIEVIPGFNIGINSQIESTLVVEI